MRSGDAGDPIGSTTPNVARMYDFYLGGKDHFAADREAARRVLELAPFTPLLAAQNRGFLRRSVRLLSSRGVRQFLDLGAGLPTRGNVHEVARDADPGARVVYLDCDPVVVAHGRALLTSGDGLVEMTDVDMRDPERILGDAVVRRVIDFERPVGLLMNSVLHCLTDDEDPYGIVATLLEALVPGSYLAISHTTGNDGLTSAVGAIYDNATTGMTYRSPEKIEKFFTGTELLDPGVVPLAAWRPDLVPVPRGGAERRAREKAAAGKWDLDRYYLCGVGRKPSAVPE
ncbi:SAM-dependent methyltransferase [Actinocorallia longicatena]|uniref:SAM-dependent methyltransferase n=1 Tax=Actinocorallia longicatena TaxID=111803 RepID=A0ABP6QG25_9ACTN